MYTFHNLCSKKFYKNSATIVFIVASNLQKRKSNYQRMYMYFQARGYETFFVLNLI